ncbi:hypothetical protein NQ317_009139, partial [Molorchus minor]
MQQSGAIIKLSNVRKGISYNNVNIKKEDTVDNREYSLKEPNGREILEKHEQKEISQAQICELLTKHGGNVDRYLPHQKYNLEVHMYKCEMCKYQTKRKECLKQHSLVHKEISEVQLYKCEICEYETKRKGNIKQHSLVHRDISEVQFYKCEMCEYGTKRKGNIKQHLLIHRDISKVQLCWSNFDVYIIYNLNVGFPHPRVLYTPVIYTRVYRILKLWLRSKDDTSIYSYRDTHAGYHVEENILILLRKRLNFGVVP